MGPIQTLPEILSWLRRRAMLIVFTSLLGLVAGVLLALNTDRVYRASAVIQVLNPVIDPRDGNGTSTIVRRVQAIEQRIMARDNLLELGERHGMFDGLDLSPTERMLMMRQSIAIEAVAAAQAGFTRDGSLSALIVSASARTPEASAALANDLADDVVRENAEQRRERAQSALRFFTEEERRIEGLIVELEAEIFRLSVDPTGRIVRSTFFVPVVEQDAVVLTGGRGFGHGMGLCQYGAAALADAGWQASRILRFYYPGSQLTRAY